MFRRLFLIVFLVFILTSTSSAADVFKVAVIDFNEFMDNSNAGKAIRKEIQDKGDQLRSELEKLQADLKTDQKRYQREAPLWTEERKLEEEKAFRIRVDAFNKLKTDNEKEFAEFSNKKLNEAKGNVIKYAEKKGKEEGYHLIFEKRTGSILYVSNSINITGQVIRDIGNGTKKQ